MKKIVSAPYIDQTARWVNGCESISSVMLLQAVGIPIDPDVFIERDLPHAPTGNRRAGSTGLTRCSSTPATPTTTPGTVAMPLHRAGLAERVGA